MSSAEIYSTISQPSPALKQYHQLVHGLNSLLVLFQHLVWLADGAVCDNINTMSDRLQNGWIGGLFSPPPDTFLAPPWQKSIARVHRLGLVLRRVRHRCQIGCCFCRSGKDVSAMHQ
jgi:hypothetical protein